MASQQEKFFAAASHAEVIPAPIPQPEILQSPPRPAANFKTREIIVLVFALFASAAWYVTKQRVNRLELENERFRAAMGKYELPSTATPVQQLIHLDTGNFFESTHPLVTFYENELNEVQALFPLQPRTEIIATFHTAKELLDRRGLDKNTALDMMQMISAKGNRFHYGKSDLPIATIVANNEKWASSTLAERLGKWCAFDGDELKLLKQQSVRR